MTPRRGNMYYSLSFLPAIPSSLSWTLEGLFELTRRPSRALNLPCALLPELQRNKDTVRCAALGAEVQGHRKEQLSQTLIVGLLKRTCLVHRSLIVKSQQNLFELVTKPAGVRISPETVDAGAKADPLTCPALLSDSMMEGAASGATNSNTSSSLT